MKETLGSRLKTGGGVFTMWFNLKKYTDFHFLPFVSVLVSTTPTVETPAKIKRDQREIKSTFLVNSVFCGVLVRAFPSHLGSVESHPSKDGLRDAGPFQLVPDPLVDLAGDLRVGRHLRLHGLAVGAAVDGRVVQVLLRQGLLRQQPVHRVLLVEDLRHHQLLVDQLGADGGGHQARVVQTGELGLSARRLAAVRRRAVGHRGNRRGRGLLRRAAGDGLLLGEAQVVVVGAGRGEVGQAVHFSCREIKVWE